MINILEFVYDSDTKPSVGGRNGYVFNIIESLKDNENVMVHTLHSESQIIKSDKVPNFVKSLTKIIRENHKINSFIKGDYTINDINAYDIIHFERSIDLYQYRKCLKNFNGKVVLTDHSPIPPFSEWYENYYSDFAKKFGGKKVVERYKKCLEEAYYLTDYILFPCENADDAYPKYWENYPRIKTDNKNKYVYLPTGSVSQRMDIDKPCVRKEHGCDDKFVACYVGRHNYSKGYDILIDIGTQFLVDKSNQMIVCGNEGPFFAPKLSNWKEIGWTKEANKFISMSDVFILPNRETYFDLVMLEVLSIGQIVVASRTGGNKFFEKYNNIGVFLYDTVEEANEILLNIKSMRESERELLRENNRKLYAKLFTVEEFGKRYESFYCDVVADKVRKNY